MREHLKNLLCQSQSHRVTESLTFSLPWLLFLFLDAWASQEPTMSVTLSHCHTVTFSLKSLPLQPLTYVWHPFTTPSLLLTHLDIMTLPKGQKCQKCQNIKISKISKISKNVKKNAKNLIILDNPKTPKTKCKKRIYGFWKWGDCQNL